MKKILVIVLMFSVIGVYAQKERTLKVNKETDLIEVTYYHDNGEVSQTGTYTKDGKLHGDWFSFCEEGNKLVSAKYDNGKKVGKWFFWSGTILKEVDYSNNAVASVNEWRNNSDVASRN